MPTQNLLAISDGEFLERQSGEMLKAFNDWKESGFSQFHESIFYHWARAAWSFAAGVRERAVQVPARPWGLWAPDFSSWVIDNDGKVFTLPTLHEARAFIAAHKRDEDLQALQVDDDGLPVGFDSGGDDFERVMWRRGFVRSDFLSAAAEIEATKNRERRLSGKSSEK